LSFGEIAFLSVQFYNMTKSYSLRLLCTNKRFLHGILGAWLLSCEAFQVYGLAVKGVCSRELVSDTSMQSKEPSLQTRTARNGSNHWSYMQTNIKAETAVATTTYGCTSRSANSKKRDRESARVAIAPAVALWLVTGKEQKWCCLTSFNWIMHVTRIWARLRSKAMPH
jgi:hypothetical protein